MPQKMTNETKWRKTLYWLRKNFPVYGRVSVRQIESKKISGDHGECAIYTDDSFIILINKSKSLDARMDTLLHEWAHVLTWFYIDQDDERHTAEWGVIYARIYSEHEEWDFGRKQHQKNKPLPGQREFAFTDKKT